MQLDATVWSVAVKTLILLERLARSQRSGISAVWGACIPCLHRHPSNLAAFAPPCVAAFEASAWQEDEINPIEHCPCRLFLLQTKGAGKGQGKETETVDAEVPGPQIFRKAEPGVAGSQLRKLAMTLAS